LERQELVFVSQEGSLQKEWLISISVAYLVQNIKVASWKLWLSCSPSLECCFQPV